VLIRVYDDAGNVIETHEHAGDFKEPGCRCTPQMKNNAQLAPAPDKGCGERSIYDTPHMTFVFLTFNVGVLAAQV
jgi:hypothetical protein